SIGLSSDTASFAVESIRKWWYAEGAAEYANSRKIVLTADCGGSNGNRNRLWKLELQRLANELDKDIQVLHYPPGTSKWNKIEHRMFSFISKNWQGIPLVSVAVIINLIAGTKTEKGLSIRCVLDEAEYEKGVQVTDEEFDSVNILSVK
ncbi:MAG: ISAzo13 family transposase, partial [Oscillospiraceae bacterium]|nr:ISAzo13 family transposase [Oscillospiraceae bacterium]